MDYNSQSKINEENDKTIPEVQNNRKYCKHCGELIDNDCVVCPKCGKQVETLNTNTASQPNIIINNANNNTNTNQQMGNAMYGISPKSRLLSLIFCIFLGVLGVHRFYVGKIGTGILYLLTVGFFGIGVFIDFILILCGAFRDSYGMQIKKW